MSLLPRCHPSPASTRTCPQAEPARDFIRAALNKDAARRPTMHQLLRHSWLRAYQVGGSRLGFGPPPACTVSTGAS